MKLQRASGMNPDILLIGVCILEGFFPIIVKSTASVFPPFFFVGISSAVAAFLYFLVITLRGGFRIALPFPVFIDCLLVSLFIFTGFILIFVGAKYTTAINTALLLQFEMVTTYIVYEFFFRQSHTRRQLAGATIVFCGSLLVLYNGSFALNKGDLIILSSTFCFPFGNFFAKRALKSLPPTHVLFLRFSIVVPVLLGLSLMFENLSGISQLLSDHGWLVLLYAVCILFCSKLLWYSGLRHMSVSRGIFILMAYPAFTLVFAFALLREMPTWYQVLGFVIAMTGIFILTRTKDSIPLADPV